MKHISLIALSACISCTLAGAQQSKEISYKKLGVYNPPTYVCYKLPAPITIDGKLSPGEWDAIPWTSDFVDMLGDKGPAPYLQTRAKMAHDDNGIYFGVWMEETNIWATYTNHDASLYQENAFEFFIDPSNNTHNYLEYEINALGTEWDLFLTKPYRDAPMITLSDWEFLGMKSAVHLEGTINNPNDIDKFWSVEIFVPWKSIYQVASQRRQKPLEGDQMRIDFQRVEWPLEVRDGKYVKVPKPGEQRPSSYFWLWAPIESGSSHAPEYWGYVQFTSKVAGTEVVPFAKNPEEDARWMLRNLYFRQSEYKRANGTYASSIADLKPEEIFSADQIKALTLHTTPSFYEITFPFNNKILHISQDGLIW
ncbi:hypothetical protein FACS189414_0260 [Bacteroidia bacterium]|nr:hypothetical protein FACS189414_0260 [Bacteroidia bacterium]